MAVLYDEKELRTYLEMVIETLGKGDVDGAILALWLLHGG